MESIKASQAANKTYDFVVVGGGSAGATIAARLSEDKSVSVLLIEAGDEATELDAKIPLGAAKMQNSERDWGYFAEVCGEFAFKGLDDHRGYWPRGRALGGSSIINYMAYVRGAKEDFDTWERMGAKGWGYDDVLPYFIKAEDCRSIGQPHADLEPEFHGRGGPLTTSVKVPNETCARFVKAATQVGFTPGDYNGRNMNNVVGLFTQTIRDGARCDTATAYLRPSVSRPNLTILKNGMAKRLILDESNERVKGVEVGAYSTSAIGPSVRVWAKNEVIVCCGAIDTPKLLMLSGLGPREHLEENGVTCIKDIPDVGANLEDHVASYILFKGTDKAKSVNGKRGDTLQALAEWAIWGTGYLASPAYDATLFYTSEEWAAEAPDCGPDLQIGFSSSPGDELVVEKNVHIGVNHFKGHYEPDSEGFLFVPTLLHMRTTGKIELKSNNPADAPRIVSNFLKSEKDVLVLAKCLRKCVEIARAPALAEVTVSSDPVVPLDMAEKYGGIENDEFWMEYARHYGTCLYHPTTTCAIGKVVDERCRVYGIKGLRIADASIMPQVISGNTNAPTIMIGEKAADMIKQDYGLTTDVPTMGPPPSASGSNTAFLAAAAAIAGGLFIVGRL
ncbi:Glucose dehydrogenase FAD, quinone [Hondaea fermentalgiana]|uniref:Glucose dehydrogenase FAD, quinone n=1 Tax=Hondaea fermentalgiana TaxID=2315210 RepID=A0A2R5GE61_9STRA|nr:Glucose dehydrogenase FAD, quinone [Hondaea fermentalgiana]|eukprot:GBG26094.1 Glucose dehydrogenase FAD, quinone [Hondaea fermentalgiana]